MKTMEIGRNTIRFPKNVRTENKRGSRVPKPPKSRLTPKELREFRQLLLEKRGALLGNVDGLRDETRGDCLGEAIDIRVFPNTPSLVREIDEALQRIEDKTYGICEATNKVIAKERLRFVPWTRYCVAYARQHGVG